MKSRLEGGTAVCALLAILSLAAAPYAVGNGFDPVSQSISETAAQATPGSWVGRTGLALLGVAGLLKSHDRPPAVTAGLRLFGGALIATAVWSYQPWLPGLPVDGTEARLHSYAAFAASVGIVIAFAALVWRPDGKPRPSLRRLVHLFLLALTAVTPLMMNVQPALAGIWQRVMFLAVALWLAWPIRRPCPKGAR